MTQINFSEAKDFLENVSKADRVGILTHDDMDGMASGVLFYDYCKQKGCNDIKHFSFTIGKTKVSGLNLEDRTKLLVADVAPNLIYPDLNDVKIPVMYTDHHNSENLIFNENIRELRTSSQGYIPSSRTVFELCGGKDWMSLIGVLSDFGDKYLENKTFVEDILKNYGKSVSEFGREFVYPAANFLVYFENDLDRAFNFLTNIKDLGGFSRLRPFSIVIEEELKRAEQDFDKNNEKFGQIRFYALESPYNIKTAFINKISSLNPGGVYVLGGKFGDTMGISARNQARIYDMRKLLKDCTAGMERVSSGGHTSAAGTKFDISQLGRFKDNLKKYNLEDAIINSDG